MRCALLVAWRASDAVDAGAAGRLLLTVAALGPCRVSAWSSGSEAASQRSSGAFEPPVEVQVDPHAGDGQLQGQRPHSHNAAGFVRLIPAKMAPGVPRNGLVWPTLRMPAPYWRGICVGGDHSAGRRSSGASSGSRTISLGLRNHPDAVRRPI